MSRWRRQLVRRRGGERARRAASDRLLLSFCDPAAPPPPRFSWRRVGTRSAVPPGEEHVLRLTIPDGAAPLIARRLRVEPGAGSFVLIRALVDGKWLWFDRSGELPGPERVVPAKPILLLPGMLLDVTFRSADLRALPFRARVVGDDITPKQALDWFRSIGRGPVLHPNQGRLYPP